MMKVILDADLLIDYLLLQREEAEELGNIIENQQCQFFITLSGLDKIISLAENIYSPEIAKKLISAIYKKITICPINYELSEQANSFNLIDFESALEIACATSIRASAVLTRNPQNFDGIDFPIWLLENFPTRLQLDKCLHLSLRVNYLESQYLSNLDTPSFHPLEVVGIMEYRIRNSITTVMDFFELLKKEGYQDIMYKNFEKKYKYSESKIINILSDLQFFKMVVVKDGKASILQNLANSDNMIIANYLAKSLTQHIVVQKLYKQLKPNEAFSREYLKTLIKEVYPEDKYKSKPIKNSFPLLFEIYPDSIATKSAGDYVSRMLGWLLFTGILEKNNKETVTIPIKVNEGNQKGKLLEENAIQQLELDMSIQQLNLF
ncbi:PIN domain-containing protein [Nostoc sp. DedSLP04]|uniref:PIN domain-containing protein n=1 Tax=Nostoc sp. DedSLP04 TaxID=3075401 RepID=UPI002AD50D36|nr:PIN domain-containing protein [Nostoc sp. DedSLP04]MDZ8033461.1 PIN domain-containing protein [Nostoc sp. DedSLP04]